ncbi:hypothetical protein WMF37_39910 [Sorangium sp. So ce291]|uniref:hypothetical protein n=1 Tax=Sorangium sp. So ce291 TaxID=3133294 RepID=UPI003F61C01B
MQAGRSRCNEAGSGFGPCLGQVLPAAETCATEVDDDCDGAVNEEGAGCACVPNEVVPCYSGPPGTEGVIEANLPRRVHDERQAHAAIWRLPPSMLATCVGGKNSTARHHDVPARGERHRARLRNEVAAVKRTAVDESASALSFPDPPESNELVLLERRSHELPLG